MLPSLATPSTRTRRDANRWSTASGRVEVRASCAMLGWDTAFARRSPEIALGMSEGRGEVAGVTSVWALTDSALVNSLLAVSAFAVLAGVADADVAAATGCG